jgi:hypothetical protein
LTDIAGPGNSPKDLPSSQGLCWEQYGFDLARWWALVGIKLNQVAVCVHIRPHPESYLSACIPLITALPKERPVIQWDERDVQAVCEGDLVNNYDVLREYLFQVGESTPFPSLLDHKAWASLNHGLL